MKLPETLNFNFLDTQYQRYLDNPESVSRDWQIFFSGFDMGFERSASVREPANSTTDAKVWARIGELIHRYRDIGHLLACMDPLSACPTEHPLLEIENFGFSTGDMDKVFPTPQFTFMEQGSLKEIVQILKQTYCRCIGVEYMHLQDPGERLWLQQRMEPVRNTAEDSEHEKSQRLIKLTQSALFEQFLNKKYLAVTRFSLEGADGIIAMLDTMLHKLADLDCREMILGMAHRGRLNVQANILNKPIEEILAEFETCYDSGQLIGAGDVKYHNGYLSDIRLGNDDVISALLVNNPSHLEAVNPVVEGIVRARQQIYGKQGPDRVVPVLLHGDAAFAGQGVVAETLNMSQLEGYRTGGTIHIVINNQIGYTTLPEDARSTRYSTDVAKMLMVPIFHVHGENPDALAHVIRLAVEYRYAFKKDVVIDVICYRRFGHNEADEPYFTQPLMYERIRERPPAHKLYARQLISEAVITQKAFMQMQANINRRLEDAYEQVHASACPFPQSGFFDQWEGYHGRFSFKDVKTGINVQTLVELARRINTLPENFSAHSKVKMLLRKRLEAVEKAEGIDWANAESLAFAALLRQGHPIRLSGQDSGRGTFSQRHSVVFDRKTGKPYIPLRSIGNGSAAFHVHNSLLAEASVLGFEYGYAVAQPLGLTIWEAQFGDFANNAQAVIDLFLASGESKWRRLCGLVLLLPHGWEGLGPEHSSARLERFLQLCADDNMQVCDLTTPAQYFHLLRRQALCAYRKVLILMTPKSLLRHPMAVSKREDLSSGGFYPLIDDAADPREVTKVLLCSGKIYYQLLLRRNALNTNKIAIVRLEQYYPFPEQAFKKMQARYKGVQEWVWVQEAPQNMGGWQFVKSFIEPLINRPLIYSGRKPAASPATGFPNIYKQEQEAISDQAVGPLTSGGATAG
ncbi:MAG: 2-oxoglutarate dehydrogenase E1 component [Desulfobacteraceae bacterium]|nr:2-oxoglutarate dehydrogenase E1 component [Desulfobacteraceae bacterium]